MITTCAEATGHSKRARLHSDRTGSHRSRAWTGPGVLPWLVHVRPVNRDGLRAETREHATHSFTKGSSTREGPSTAPTERTPAPFPGSSCGNRVAGPKAKAERPILTVSCAGRARGGHQEGRASTGESTDRRGGGVPRVLRGQTDRQADQSLWLMCCQGEWPPVPRGVAARQAAWLVSRTRLPVVTSSGKTSS